MSKITSNLKIFIGGSPLLNYFRSIPQEMYLGEWVLSILPYPLLIYITFKCPLCKIGRIKVLIFQDVLKIKQDKELKIPSIIICQNTRLTQNTNQ